jgi:hypothetical protein
MGKLGQKNEHIDNATNDIMDEIRDYFWHEHNIDLEEYTPNFMGTPDEVLRTADDEIYSIIHNNLKKMI